LGIGEKQIAIPVHALQVQRRDNDWHLVVEATKDALRAAPSYEDPRANARSRPGGAQPGAR
jgi:hypothetical protein